MRLSKNFTEAELTKTNTGILNYCNWPESERLFYLANYLLQPIRDKFGALQISSGYRNEKVNNAVDGEKTSAHLRGMAADFIPLDAPIDQVFEWAKKNLVYSQVILENKEGKRWIHIALAETQKQNQIAMIYENNIYKIIA